MNTQRHHVSNMAISQKDSICRSVVLMSAHVIRFGDGVLGAALDSIPRIRHADGPATCSSAFNARICV